MRAVPDTAQAPPVARAWALGVPTVWALAVPAAVAVAVFVLGYANGGYDVPARGVAAILVWWTLALGVGLRFLPLEPVPRAVGAVAGLLGAFGLLGLASVAWGASAEDAFLELDRAALLAGVFLLAALASTRRTLEGWLDGLAAGIVALAVVALASRCFPGVFSTRGLAEFLPSWQLRLSFPVGYWNGLAILVALPVPLLLRAAVAERPAALRAAALAPFPVLAAVVYLTSSRGGVATALAGAVAYLALAPRRWAVAGALGVAVASAAAAVTILGDRPDLVDGPIDSAAAASQGRSAALLILLVAAAAAAVWWLASRLAERHGRVPPPAVGRAVAGVAVAATLALLVAADPVQKFEQFRRSPDDAALSGDFVRAHLTSANGSGRWQFWTSAVDAWQSKPLTGRGAGSFEVWWAEHGLLSRFLRDAHSLYLETLAELGPLGLVLLLAALGGGLAAGVRRLRGAGSGRDSVAALVAVVLAFLLALAIDWVWELTIVAAVGVAALGLLLGPATAGAGRRLHVSFAGGAAFVVAAWLIVCAQALPVLSELQIRRSESAAGDGDTRSALAHARSARSIQPWAASPYLQLALVEEASGRLDAARGSIREAIERDDDDWRLWLVSARIETKAGNVAEARRSLDRAVALNPRSPLFQDVRS